MILEWKTGETVLTVSAFEVSSEPKFFFRSEVFVIAFVFVFVLVFVFVSDSSSSHNLILSAY